MRMWLLRVAVCALLIPVVACSSPEVKKKKYFDRGNAAFEKKQYSEAVLAYRNAIKIDPKFGEARLKLAQTYERSGYLADAASEYSRAADLMPGNAATQVAAAKYLLQIGRFEDARTRAKRAIDVDANNVEAHIMLGSAIAGMKDLDGAMKEIEEAISLSPDKSVGYTNKAGLLLAQGRQAEALKNFQKAVEIEPQSVPAILALASYYWSVGSMTEAEAAIGRALKVDPKSAVANRGMALLYMATDRSLAAEPYVKAAVAAAATPEADLSLADYYLRTSRPAVAKPILDRLANIAKTSAAANIKLAQMEYSAGDHAMAYKRLDAVIAQSPGSSEARMTRARYLLAEGRPKDALADAEAAAQADPRSAAAHLQLGRVRAALGQIEQAKASFGEVVKLNPRSSVAQASLAALNLSTGSSESAVQFAQDAVKNQPNSLVPRLLLVRGLLSRGELDQAATELAFLKSKLPNHPTVRALNGALLLMKKDVPGARREYEAALQSDPGDVDALAGLTNIEAQQGKLGPARDRIAVQLARSPKNPGLLLLAARTDLRAGDLAAGEVKLRQVVEIAPATLDAYMLLGRLYVQQKKLDDARRQFEALAAHQGRPIGALTVIGMIHQLQNSDDEALKAYQRALDIDPNAAVAANNVAYILAQRNQNLDHALALAKTAALGLPNEPNVRDTVGWVYYKKQQPTLAVAELEKSVRAVPTNALFQYHLGLAYAGAGETDKARRALEEALRLNPSFEGAAEARQALASLKG